MAFKDWCKEKKSCPQGSSWGFSKKMYEGPSWQQQNQDGYGIWNDY